MLKNIMMEADGVNIGGSTTPESTESSKESDKEANHVEQKEIKEQKTFTQDDVDKIVEKRLARERAKMEKEYADKADKTVNDKLSEAERLSKMTKEEKREYELSKREKAIADKEAEYAKRELKISAMSILEDKGIVGETAKQFSTLLDYTDADKCKSSIDNITKLFEGLVQKEVDKRIGKTKTPKSNSSSTQEISKGVADLKKKFGIK